MAAVVEANLLSAIIVNMITAAETIDTGKFTAEGTPSFSSTNSTFPNGRTEKMIEFNGTTDYYNYDAGTYGDYESCIISCWVKPDFTQTYATDSAIFGTYDTVTYDGFTGYFESSIDDFRMQRYLDGSNVAVDTAGETWAADDMIHMVFMFNNTAALDDSKSMTLYINGVLVASGTSTWAIGAGDVESPNAVVGAYRTGGVKYWLGELYDYTVLEYDTLATTNTDLEIANALYDNEYGTAGAYKFSYELSSTPPTTAGLTIAGEKIRLRTDTDGTVTTAIEIADDQVATFTEFPITPSSPPTTDYQVANKKYVDSGGGGITITEDSGSPTITPDAVGDVYINTDNLNVYMASETNGSYNWAFVGKGESSAFTKDTVTGLKAWFKAGAGVTMDGGNIVSAWADQSDSGWHVGQATVAKRPLYVSSVINGHPVIRFDGVDDVINQTTASVPNPFHVFIVGKYISNQYGNVLFGGSNTVQMTLDGVNFAMYAGGGGFSVSAFDTNNHLFICTFSPSIPDIFTIDGVAYNGDTGSNTLAGLSFGNTTNLSYNYTNCDVAECLVFNSNLSSENIDKVVTYLNNKYAIY